MTQHLISGQPHKSVFQLFLNDSIIKNLNKVLMNQKESRSVYF